jgi:hypothetical protein
MTFPAFLLGFFIAGLMAAVFHLVRGGSLGRLIILLVAGEISFWFGHMVGNILGFTFLSVGPIRLGMAILTAILGLVGATWLSEITPYPEGDQ